MMPLVSKILSQRYHLIINHLNYSLKISFDIFDGYFEMKSPRVTFFHFSGFLWFKYKTVFRIWRFNVVIVLPRLDTSYDTSDRNMESSKASNIQLLLIERPALDFRGLTC